MNGDTFTFKMIGDDQLTRPLKQAENQMKNLGNQVAKTNKQMGAFGSNLVGTGRNLKRFAMGSLQQAGYQLGDYAVQVANGTSRMQAFGQQAPQFLQIFGPIGSAVGAAVAIFAAYSVAAEKMADSMGQVQKAMKDLRGLSEDLAMKFQMIKFGVDTEAEAIALRELAHLHLNYLDAVRQYEATDDLGSRQRQAEDIRDLKSLIANQQKIVDELTERREALQLAIGLGEKYNRIELAHAKILGDQKRERAATMQALRKSALVEATLANAARIANINAYVQYTQSRIAAHQMTVREEALQVRQSHAEQLKIMGETQLQAITDAEKIKQAYATYYASRIQGEKLAAAAAIAAQNAMKRQFETKVYSGRGGDPRKMASDYMNQLGYKSIDELIEELTGAPDKVREVADPLADLKARIGMERDLLHASDARRQVMEAIFQSERQYTPQQIEDTVKQIEAYNQQVKEMERIKSTADMIGAAFENAFMSMIEGTKSAKDAFKDLTRSIIADLYRQYVVKQITGFITQSVGAMMAGPVQGPNLPSGRVLSGGGYTGNGSRSGGLDGRGGFMAMLHPRETVIDHAKGQSAGGVVVQQTFNFSANGDDSVKQIIAGAMPQIAKATQNAIVDARRRGGSMKQAFG